MSCDANAVSDDDLLIFLHVNHQEQQLEDGIPIEKKMILNNNNIRKHLMNKNNNFYH